MSISQKEVDERIEFLLKYVRLGMSRNECQRIFQAKYHTGIVQARVWYVRATDGLIAIDPDSRSRTRAVILEILHGQLVGHQSDMGKITDRLVEIEADNERRSMVVEQLAVHTDEKQIKSLNRELKTIPSHPVKVYLDAIESRSKTRERIIKCCTEIGRLHGLYVEELPIIKAIQVMAQSELIPAAVASDLLTLIGSLERNIDTLSLN